ncbi:hypothetical protein MBLNU459_g5037t3 [Dothideomycetes sp. NU459]
MTKTNGAESKRRKRKASEEKKESNGKEDRKRVQNRISQQCLREKQLARTRHLESVMNLIKSSTGTAQGQSGNAAGMESQLKLISEIEQLREALFRMRKKLLSLSNMAAAAAEDSIFETLLSGESSTTRSRDSSEPDTAAGDIATAAPGANLEAETVPADTSPADDGIIVNIDRTDLPGASHSDMPMYDLLATTQELDHTMTNCLHATESTFSFGSSLDPTCFDGERNFCAGLGDVYENCSKATPGEGGEQRCSLTLLEPTALPLRTRQADLAEKIVKACLRYHRSPFFLYQQNGQMRRNVVRPNNVDVAEIAKSLSMIAVHLMASSAGIQPYLYGVYSTADHSPVIDMVNWPEIRDQLIIHSNSVDLDRIMKDVVLNTVIEDPSLEVSPSQGRMDDFMHSMETPATLSGSISVIDPSADTVYTGTETTTGYNPVKIRHHSIPQIHHASRLSLVPRLR